MHVWRLNGWSVFCKVFAFRKRPVENGRDISLDHFRSWLSGHQFKNLFIECWSRIKTKDVSGVLFAIPNHHRTFLNQYTSITTVIHLIGPFSLNLISAVGIVFLLSIRRAKVHRERDFRAHLLLQLREQKYLIISPLGLILTAVPRLILTFQLECMKSAPWSCNGLSLRLFHFISPIDPSLRHLHSPIKHLQKRISTSDESHRLVHPQRLQVTDLLSSVHLLSK